MNAIAQYIVNTSTLDVSSIKIINATKEYIRALHRTRMVLTYHSSFHMSITSVVNKTGPIAATMSASTFVRSSALNSLI